MGVGQLIRNVITAETDPTVANFTKSLTSNNTILTAVNAATGTISASVLPSYVDDVLNFANLAAFPVAGDAGKIYVIEDNNKVYRWSGSVYVEISSSATAGEALKLTTPRTISTTGDATYSVSFDGSANVSSAITLATVNSNVGAFGGAGSIPVVTVNGKGQITAVSTNSIGNELIAIQALADSAGFLKKTGDGNYSIDSNTYLPTSNEVNKYISTFRKTGATNPAINIEDGEVTIPDYSSLVISPPLTANTVAVLGSVGSAIGGCSLNGFSNNLSEIALALSGYSGKTTATENAVVIFNAAKHSGTTNIVALASNDIAFDFSNNFTTIVRISGNGNINASGRVASSSGFSVGSNQVVSARRTGWAAPTGTATRTTFATSTVTLSQLAERVKALIDDLTAHGLIGV